MGNFYCQKVCGSEDFSIEEWNKAYEYCNEAGIEGIERDKILSPELFPCTNQCFDCCAIVGETRLKTQKLINKNKIMNKKFYTFGEAIDALKNGKLVAREGWNGKGMFIFMRPSDELTIDMIVHKVKSIPQSLKDYYARQTIETQLDGESTIKFTEYLCMKSADGSIVNGWLASQTDILAEDWVILE